MQIVSRAKVVDNSPQVSGKYRAIFTYILEDAQVITRNFSHTSKTEIDSMFVSLEAEVEAQAQECYERDIIEQGLPVADYTYATADQICREYIRRGMQADIQDAYTDIVINVNGHLDGLQIFKSNLE